MRDAKAETSASANASVSAAIARAERGTADASASATVSREATLTPELRARRNTVLSGPGPVKSSQLNEGSAKGAATGVGCFLNLHHYAFMTGNTTEFAAMSDDCYEFYKSTVDNANDIYSRGRWADKWDQEVVNMTHYEKLKGYEHNRVKVIVNYRTMASYYSDGQNPSTSKAAYSQEASFGVRYNNGRWVVGAIEATSK